MKTAYIVSPINILNDMSAKYLKEDQEIFYKLLAVRNIDSFIIRTDLQEAYLKKRAKYTDFDTYLDSRLEILIDLPLPVSILNFITFRIRN